MRLFTAKTLAAIFLCFSSHAFSSEISPFQANRLPVSEFVNWVSGRTGANIAIGPGVDGFVTFSVNELSEDKILTFFDRVMTAQGYTVTNSNGLYQVTTAPTIEPEEPLTTRIYDLQYLKNTTAVDLIKSALTTSSPLERLSVSPLTGRNSVLVTASPELLSILDDIINEIDTQTRQVRIEAVIIETDLGSSSAAGVNLSNARSVTQILSQTMQPVTSLATVSDGGYLTYSGSNFGALITALATNAKTKILSTPNLIVLDREEGRISVGQNVPFLTSRETTDGGTVIQQIERQDVGVTLSIVPHVLESGQVVLRINQQSSSVSNSTIAADIITNNRSITTVAKLNSGETISLGGLVGEQERDSVTGIPLLRDIPWFGAIFRYKSKSTVRTELNVVLTAYII